LNENGRNEKTVFFQSEARNRVSAFSETPAQSSLGSKPPRKGVKQREKQFSVSHFAP